MCSSKRFLFRKGSIFFLRFICPSLVQVKECHEQLMDVAKILQLIANGVEPEQESRVSKDNFDFVVGGMRLIFL